MARSLKSNKAPGPDGVPKEVLKLIAEERVRVLLYMYNTCLTRGVFPIRWKHKHTYIHNWPLQRFSQEKRQKGDPTQASSYQPLYMLDRAGKLLKKLLKFRLNAAMENAADLSERQYGFRADRSTIGSTNEVLTSLKAVQNVSRNR